jgi:hypothetical protein
MARLYRVRETDLSREAGAWAMSENVWSTAAITLRMVGHLQSRGLFPRPTEPGFDPSLVVEIR